MATTLQMMNDIEEVSGAPELVDDEELEIDLRTGQATQKLAEELVDQAILDMADVVANETKTLDVVMQGAGACELLGTGCQS